MSRKQMRHNPKRRYTARARPQRRHRVYALTLNLGFRCCFSINAFFANGLPLALAFALATEREAERREQRAASVVRGGGGHDRDVHAPHGVDAVVVDLRKDELLG